MSQLIQRHQRSHSDSFSTDYQGVQTKRLQSFISLVQDLYQQDTFKDAEKVAKEMADTTRKVQQQEENIAKLQSELQAEKDKSAEKIRLMETDFGRFRHEFLKGHREEVSKKDSEMKGAYEALESARSKIAEHENTVHELTNTRDQLERQGKDLKQVQKEVENLLEKVKQQDDRIQLDKGKIARDEANIKTLESGGIQLRLELREKEVQADQYKSELLELQRFSGALDVDDHLRVKKSIASLWSGYYDAVRNAFEPNLHEGVLMSPLAWKNLVSTNQVTHATPLPRSNSPVAKFMRTMVVLAFISRQLVSMIFTTTHLVEDDGALRSNRLTLAEEDPPKEAFLRGLLASLPDGRESQMHISAVVTQVRGVVEGLLSAETANRFFTDLQKITVSAVDLGTYLRTRQSCFEIDTEIPDEPSWIWRSVSLSDTATHTLSERRVSVADFVSDAAELIVFPRVFVVGPNRDTLIVPGKVLQKSSIEDARQELAAASPQIPRAVSTRLTRARRASVYDTDQGSGLGKSDSFLDSRNGSKV